MNWYASIFLLLITYPYSKCSGQNIEYYTGLDFNRYRFTDESPGNGFYAPNNASISLGLSMYKLEGRNTNRFFNFTGRLTYQKNDFTNRHSGLGSFSTVRGSFKTLDLTIVIHALNIPNKNKNFLFSIGPLLGLNIYEEVEGTRTSRNLQGDMVSERIGDDYEISSDIKIGVNLSIRYFIRVVDQLNIVPSYMFTLGIGPEFPRLASKKVHSIGLGISYEMN